MRKAFLKLFYLILYLSVIPFSGNTQSYNNRQFIKEINIQGNEKTNESIIRRELLFSQNTIIKTELLEENIIKSTSNLLKTSLFHEVFIDKVVLNDSTVNINILLKERWYTWIWPLIEHPDRNLNVWWEHKDATRLSAGIHFQQENFRGKNEKINVRALAGFREFINLDYEVPYINQSKTLGFKIATVFNSQKEINYITTENLQQRFFSNEPLLNLAEVELSAIFRPRLRLTNIFSARYVDLKFHDTLQMLNANFFGEMNNPNFLGLNYQMKLDYRNQRSYPTKGFYLESEFSLLKQTNHTYNQLSQRNSIRLYYSIKKFLFATEATTKFTFPLNKPYYLQNALGYDRNYIRGYEYLVIEGPHFFISKYNLRYSILSKKYINLNFIKSSKFNKIPLSIYAGPHLDMGIAWPKLDYTTNSLQNKFLKGYGIGIDFITYYDKVLRIEYTVGEKNTAGFFIHFMSAI